MERLFGMACQHRHSCAAASGCGARAPCAPECAELAKLHVQLRVVFAAVPVQVELWTGAAGTVCIFLSTPLGERVAAVEEVPCAPLVCRAVPLFECRVSLSNRRDLADHGGLCAICPERDC